MAYGAVPKDSGSIPIAEVYTPNTGFTALQGGGVFTDGSGNGSAGAVVGLSQINGVNVIMGGADAQTAASVLMGGQALYNGSTMDQRRGNLDNISLINAVAVTTTQTGTDQTNFNNRGAHVVLQMITIGTGSVTLEIDNKDPVSGQYYSILTGVAVITNSVNIYKVYPGITAVANAAASDILARTWRVKVVANNANATTYKVGVILIV